MSDCSANAWAVPAECERPHFAGSDEIVIDSMLPAYVLEAARTVRIRQLPDVTFAKLETCTMTVEYEGYPTSDFLCSACGKLHNAPRIRRYCPRCGAMVAGTERP